MDYLITGIDSISAQRQITI